MKDKKLEYTFVESPGEARRAMARGESLSPSSALAIIKGAWEEGRIHLSSHFRQQASSRNFNTLDAERVIHCGSMCGQAEFCEDFRNWKYRLAGMVGDRKLEIVMAIDPSEDYSSSPLIVLITGYWR